MGKQEGSSNDGKPQNKASRGLAKYVARFVRVTFHEFVAEDEFLIKMAVFSEQLLILASLQPPKIPFWLASFHR